VSRLRGYLDIASINCPDGMNEVDHILMFRRAVLLRSLLETHLKEIFDTNTQEARIEPDLLRAFLTVPRYEHESRSMRAIIEMSRASPRGRFQRSSLPAREQLKMHVDAREFFDRMDRAWIPAPDQASQRAGEGLSLAEELKEFPPSSDKEPMAKEGESKVTEEKRVS
jgi:hypothetical protein